MVLPAYYLIFARKLIFEKFGGGGAAAPLSPMARTPMDQNMPCPISCLLKTVLPTLSDANNI